MKASCQNVCTKVTGCCRVHGNYHGWLPTCDNERNVLRTGDTDVGSSKTDEPTPTVEKRVEPYAAAGASMIAAPGFNKAEWRKKCGCLRTSQKLKQILEHFPQPPPPPPTPNYHSMQVETPAYCPTYCSVLPNYDLPCAGYRNVPCPTVAHYGWVKKKEHEVVQTPPQKGLGRIQSLIADLVQIVQVAVTVTALALYYLIYCYMQLIYCTLSSLIFFLRADGPMKVTIGVVTVTSLIVGFHLILRLERLLGIRP